MNEKDRGLLRQDGYQVYRVKQHTLGKNAVLDAAAGKVPAEHYIAGSTREEAAGGRPLTCWVDLEDSWFVVWMPPLDECAFEKSQIKVGGRAVGFRPSQEGAEFEFARWLQT
jgi:hypothetical protein